MRKCLEGKGGKGRSVLAAMLGLAFVLVPGARSWAAPGGDGCCGGDGAGGGAAAKKGEEAKKETGKKGTETKEPAGLLLDLGNARCPVMGGKPDGKTFSEWKGLRVNHCCPMCSAKFLADPEAALKKAGIEWKDAADAAAKVGKAKGAEREKALEAAARRWKVLRAPAPERVEPVVLDLANRVCPVSRDEAPDGTTFTVWNGLRVGFCCADCVARFGKDPAAALDAAGIAWKDAAAAARAVNEATGEAREKALAGLQGKWKVVQGESAEAKVPPAEGK